MRIERRKGDTRPDVCHVSLASTDDVANITGCTFKLVVSSVQFPVDATKVLYEVVGAISNATAGIVEFHPTPTQVDRTGHFYFEIKMTDGYGDIHTPICGNYDFK